jgi:hypothetical protein
MPRPPSRSSPPTQAVPRRRRNSPCAWCASGRTGASSCAAARRATRRSGPTRRWTARPCAPPWPSQPAAAAACPSAATGSRRASPAAWPLLPALPCRLGRQRQRRGARQGGRRHRPRRLRPGETARLRVTAPFAGRASIAVLTDRLLSIQEAEVAEGGSDIEVPVAAGWGAGAHAAVTVFRPATGARASRPGRSASPGCRSTRPPGASMSRSSRPTAPGPTPAPRSGCA